MKGAIRIFLQDVVDRIVCPRCEAKAGELCSWDEPPLEHRSVLLTHPERTAVRRAQMTDEEYAQAGLDLLRYHAHNA